MPPSVDSSGFPAVEEPDVIGPRPRIDQSISAADGLPFSPQNGSESKTEGFGHPAFHDRRPDELFASSVRERELLENVELLISIEKEPLGY